MRPQRSLVSIYPNNKFSIDYEKNFSEILKGTIPSDPNYSVEGKAQSLGQDSANFLMVHSDTVSKTG